MATTHPPRTPEEERAAAGLTPSELKLFDAWLAILKSCETHGWPVLYVGNEDVNDDSINAWLEDDA